MTNKSGNNAAGEESTKDWLSGLEEKYKDDPDFIAEGLALAVAEEAAELMQGQGISRAELASRMGVSRAYVTQILNAHPNLTLRSIAQLAIALHVTPSIHLDARATGPGATVDRVKSAR